MSHQNHSETDKVATFFEGYASGFDSIYGHSEKRSGFQKLVDNLFRRTMFLRFQKTLRYTIDPSIVTIIDIGCGPGHYCLEFLRQHKIVTGLDLSEEMLKIAQRNINTLQVKGEKHFIKADYLTHIFDKKFDAACLMGFFDYIKDPLDILLKLKKEIRKEVFASFPKSGGLLAVQRKIRYKLKNCPLYLYSKNDVTGLMNQAGFRKFEIQDCERDWFVRITV